MRSNSRSALIAKAPRLPKASTWTEWSITSSAGTSGLIFAGSPPSATIASRIAARSTTTGTPVKSCIRTRAGENAISPLGSARGSQRAIASMSAAATEPLPSVRSRFSSRIFSENGSRATSKRVLQRVDAEDLKAPVGERELGTGIEAVG